MTISEIIAKRLDLRQQQVENTMELLEGGATIPFYITLPQGSHRRTQRSAGGTN